MGRVNVLRKNDSAFLGKGQSLTVKAGDAAPLAFGAAPALDNFDKWVANRVESISVANNASRLYAGSSSYAPGIADLYTYGAWSSCGGFGYGWRPFGASYSWSPFAGGNWFYDPTYGWTYLSAQPWGWAPYHYGGWLFDASCGGWFYTPGYYGNYLSRKKFPPRVNPPHPVYHATTAVFVRQNGRIGIVPMHPLDEKGKTPINIEHGILAAGAVRDLNAPLSTLDRTQKFETLKSAPADTFQGKLTAAAAPSRVSSSMLQGNTALFVGKNTLLAYDGGQHRFVTTSAPQDTARVVGASAVVPVRGNSGIVPRSSVPVASASSSRVSAPVTPGRSSSSAARSYSPPSAPRSGGSYGGGSSSSGRTSSGGSGWSGASASSGSASRSSGSSGSSASSGSSSSGGGRAH